LRVQGSRSSLTKELDANGTVLSLMIPNGVEYSGTGFSVLRTAGRAGEALALQLPAILGKVQQEVAAGFPWFVAFHHLQESYTNYPESAIKNLVIALDTIIEAHIGEIRKGYFIERGIYKQIAGSLVESIRKEGLSRGLPTDFVEHMEEVIRRENHRGTSEKRKMFWTEFEIDSEPYKDVLAYRDLILHTGHVLNYMEPIDYIAFSKEVARLRTIVNRALLRRLAYSGQMYDFENDTVVGS
jgi:hypothetical protein